MTGVDGDLHPCTQHQWPKKGFFQVKETVSRDFLHAVFFIKTRLSAPWYIPESCFKYKFEFAKIFEFEADPPLCPPPQDSILRCSPSRRIKSYDVAPCVGSNPMVWPLPQDQILRCVPPPRGIESYGVAPPAGSTLLGLERDRDMGEQGLGQGRGSDFPLWPLPRNWTFRYGPSRGIGLSDVAPPAGSNPTVWPSPRDRLPHRGIVRIFVESMLLPLKGESTKNVCMVEQYYPRPIIFML